MSNRHAVLGMLMDGPAHQYEIGSRMRNRLGPGWNLDSGQISRIVQKLEEDGLVMRSQPERGPRGRRRVVCTASSAGVAEIESWWRKPLDANSLQRTVLLKIALAAPEALPELLQVCKSFEADCVSQIAEIGERREEIAMDKPMTLADDVILRFSLGVEIATLELNLGIVLDAQRTIKWLLGEAVWPDTRTGAGNAASATTGENELFKRMARRHLRTTEH